MLNHTSVPFTPTIHMKDPPLPTKALRVEAITGVVSSLNVLAAVFAGNSDVQLSIVQMVNQIEALKLKSSMAVPMHNVQHSTTSTRCPSKGSAKLGDERSPSSNRRSSEVLTSLFNRRSIEREKEAAQHSSKSGNELMPSNTRRSSESRTILFNRRSDEQEKEECPDFQEASVSSGTPGKVPRCADCGLLIRERLEGTRHTCCTCDGI